MGVGGVLDQLKIRLTQPQVELELGLSLATKTITNYWGCLWYKCSQIYHSSLQLRLITRLWFLPKIFNNSFFAKPQAFENEMNTIWPWQIFMLNRYGKEFSFLYGKEIFLAYIWSSGFSFTDIRQSWCKQQDIPSHFDNKKNNYE